jgi:3-hydroxyisobutyrate dehydrogenase-like beta-hydroxyacid dehydrogenase
MDQKSEAGAVVAAQQEGGQCTVGWIGLGIMGREIVTRLLAQGHSVVGFNRSAGKADELVARGMQLAATPQAVAEAVSIIFVMVTDSAALDAVFAGPQGILSGLSPGKVVIDCSTVSPALSASNADKARFAGADLVDCPISGSHLSVRRGLAVTFVGGTRETFDQIRPLLLGIGPKSTYVGANGLALRLKIAINLQLAGL